MRTDTTRAHQARANLALPSDLTEAEWALLEPFFPSPLRVGRPRKWPMRTSRDVAEQRRDIRVIQRMPPRIERFGGCLGKALHHVDAAQRLERVTAFRQIEFGRQ